MIKQNTYMSRILMMLIMMVMGVGSAWGQTHTETHDGVTYNVVYLNLGGGSDSKDGSTVANAVKTWAKAYEKLPAYTGTTDADRDAAWDKNIIVVCDASNIQLNTLSVTNKVPATITGVFPWTAANTTAAKVKAGGAVYINTGNDTSGPSLGMDTKFKYLRFRNPNTGTNGQSFIQCYLHDVTFDVGCLMDDITTTLSVDNGSTSGHKAPDVHLMMYANTHSFTETADGGWPAQKKPMVLTIKSGKIGRLLSCRITGTSSTDGSIKNRYVVGNPSHPLMAILNVDIDPNTTEGDWNSKNFTNDIEFCCAGATQGAEYCDIKFNIKRGKIGTLVSACQGMSVTQTKNLGLSNSSFFGRTEVNLIPNNSDDDITIDRYYGACLGRSASNPNTTTTNGISNTAFYGVSTLNMHGGRINNGVFISAGGVSGLQSPDGNYHTCDQYIPYLDDAAAYKNYPYMGIKYQPYDASKTIAKVTTIMNGTPEVIDLAETITTMNIYGGEIKGGIYGGSYGYSDVLRIQCAMEQAGSLWGDTHVNIYGGKISGGVYGGGQGSPDFYNLAPNNRKNEFTTVASVYGNTNVNIYGGEIDGYIYGGGMGLESQAAGSGSVISFDTPTAVTLVANEFQNIAKVYGSTNVTIDPKILKPYKEWAVPNVPEFTGPDEGWAFTGNIYGGGALGAVEGNTNVIIKGGIINGNVFGAGEGEDGHPDKAMVKGDTKVIIGEKQ